MYFITWKFYAGFYPRSFIQVGSITSEGYAASKGILLFCFICMIAVECQYYQSHMEISEGKK